MCRPCTTIEENSIIPQELASFEDGPAGLIRQSQYQ